MICDTQKLQEIQLQMEIVREFNQMVGYKGWKHKNLYAIIGYKIEWMRRFYLQ